MTRADKKAMKAAMICEINQLLNCDSIWDYLADKYGADYIGAQSVKMLKVIRAEMGMGGM